MILPSRCVCSVHTYPCLSAFIRKNFRSVRETNFAEDASCVVEAQSGLRPVILLVINSSSSSYIVSQPFTILFVQHRRGERA
jgi:hypothetical protein